MILVTEAPKNGPCFLESPMSDLSKKQASTQQGEARLVFVRSKVPLNCPAILEVRGRFILVSRLSLVWDWWTVMFQLAGLYCTWVLRMLAARMRRSGPRQLESHGHRALAALVVLPAGFGHRSVRLGVLV